MSKQINLKNLPVPQSILFSKDFRKDYLNFADDEILLQQPVLILDLLFQIISDLRNNMFLDNGIFMGKDNQVKMDLWNSEFVGDERNEIRKVYNVSQFLKNRSKEQITEALQFLKLFKNEKFTFQNKAGVTITVRKFTSTKQRFFLLWLLEINQKGTSVLISTIQGAFGLNYKTNYDFIRGFIVPIKLKLDQEDSGMSFNYSIDKNNSSLLHIITYPNKPDKEVVISNNSISYKLVYIKRRHKLSDDTAKYIRTLIESDYNGFEEKYKVFLAICKKEKKIAVDYLDVEFVLKLKSLYGE